MTIPEISHAEGMSSAYVAKVMRALREGGLVVSERGQAGGYRLSRAPERISRRRGAGGLGRSTVLRRRVLREIQWQRG